MTQPAPGSLSRHQPVAVGAGLAVLAIAAAALALRTGLLSAPPEFDELYHLLAARGWLDDGAPRILDGEYTRARAFTWAVAEIFSLTGREDLATARLLPLAAGMLIPAVLFLWLRPAAGAGAAFVAAGFAVVWPQGILEAQLLRFYSLHVLAFLVGAAALYRLVNDPAGRWKTGVPLLLAAWGLALHLQITTAIGIAGAGLWAAGAVLIDRVHRPRLRRRLLAAAALIGAAGIVVAAATGLLADLWAFYRWTPQHSADTRDFAGYYHVTLRRLYPAFWTLLPILALIAIRGRPRPALFCLSIFTVGFFAHSFGGMKAERYLSYLMPFLFALWGLALVALAAPLSTALQAATRPLPGGRRTAGVLALGAVLIALAGQTFVKKAAEFAAGTGYASRGDWSGAAELVEDWRDAPFVVTTRELHMLHSLGPFDLLLSPGRLTELSPQEDFAVDPRIGRPVVGTDKGFAAVLSCHREGLLVTSPEWWEDKGRGDRLLPLFAEAGLSVQLRQEGAVLALRWRPAGTAAGAECAALPV